MTLVSFCVNSNRNRHSLVTLFPFISGGVNTHFFAACKAKSAKNALGPAESSSAPETPPAGSTCTLTLTRTFPWIVARAFGDTSGNTWSSTSPLPGAIPPALDFADTTAVGAEAAEAAGEGSSFSLVGFKESAASRGVVRCSAGAVAGAVDFSVPETADSPSGFALLLDLDKSADFAGLCTAACPDGFSAVTAGADCASGRCVSSRGTVRIAANARAPTISGTRNHGLPPDLLYAGSRWG